MSTPITCQNGLRSRTLEPNEKPGSEVLFGIGRRVGESAQPATAITLPPPFGSLIDFPDSLTAAETAINSISRADTGRPWSFPFFGFRIMVGCGLVMLGLAWLTWYLSEFQASLLERQLIAPALADLFSQLSLPFY